jgi:predicted GIY-YIG superfamily endonuclease
VKPAIVYEARNTATGAAYIGLTCQPLARRKYQHESAARAGTRGKFYAALRKYGAESFTWREIASLPTYSEAEIAECIAIAVRRPAYNVARGGSKGNLGGRASEVTRAKMRRAKTGLTKSDETRQRISKALRASPTYPLRGEQTRALHTGLKRSAETRRRISEALKGPPSAAQRAANEARRGVPLSPAHRAALSAGHQSAASRAHQQRLVALHTGRKRSPQTRARIAAALRAHWEKKRG